jgi:group I intron endonuclease
MNQGKEGIVYIATNLINNKQYIGQTVRKLKYRLYEHIHHPDNSYPFSKALRKYGIENFKIVPFSCLEKDLDWTESFLIKKLNTLKPNGYNLESGGNNQKHLHEVTKNKISKKTKGENNPRYGIKLEEETKEKIRESINEWYKTHEAPSKGILKTKEEKIKLSEARKKYYEIHESPFKGKRHSKEAKEKMRISRLEYLKRIKNERN